MSYFFKIFFLFILFVCPSLAHADAYVSLNPTDPMSVSVCHAVSGNLKAIHITGVQNRAQETSVGFTRQGEDVVKVYVSDLDKRVQSSIETVLKKCGYKINSSVSALGGSPSGEVPLQLAIYIDEFFGGTHNKFLVGKSSTKVALELVL